MLFEALLHQLDALARARPVLMVFEDAHWVDPTSRELLDLTLDRVWELPVLLVVTFRPEFQHAWAGRAHVTVMALNRLGQRDGVALVERVAGDASLSGEIVAEIVERADLRDLLGRWPEAIEPRDQRRVQSRGDCTRR